MQPLRFTYVLCQLNLYVLMYFVDIVKIFYNFFFICTLQVFPNDLNCI